MQRQKIEVCELPVSYVTNYEEIEEAEAKELATIPEETRETNYKAFRLDYLRDKFTDFNPNLKNDKQTFLTLETENGQVTYLIDLDYETFRKQFLETINR